MNRVEKLIPIAIEAAREKLANENGVIKKVYNGYISAFGATVIQAGVLPAVANLVKNTDNTEGNRKLIADALFYILKNKWYTDEKDLMSTSIKYRESATFKKRLLDATTALKLAVRTFKLEE